MMNKPVLDFNLFISYNIEDLKLAKRLANDLISFGINIRYEINFPNALIKSINDADGVIILLTSSSISDPDIERTYQIARTFRGLKIQPILYGNVEVPQFLSNINCIRWIDDDGDAVSNYSAVIEELIREFSEAEEKGRPNSESYRLVDAFGNDLTNSKESTEKEISESYRLADAFGNDLTNSKGSTEKEIFESSAPPQKNSKKVKLNPIRRVKVNSTPNYWLLNIDPDNWEIENFKLGQETYFNTYYNNDTKRIEYDSFLEAKKRDFVLVYAGRNYDKVVCIMEVTHPVHFDSELGEILKMKIYRLLQPSISLDFMESKIPDIIASLKINKGQSEVFYRLTEGDYNEIINFKVGVSDVSQHSFQPFFLTEGDHRNTEDQLDFENDINSFASVITLKKVNPPLAIGLFGNWGSGKSFFMEKLSARIDEMAKIDDSEDFAKHIVQVKFNSWHYSDTSLWASLITHIFESLFNYATDKQFGADAIESIYKDLNITSFQIEETRKKIEANEIHVKAIEEQKVFVEGIIQQKKDSLELWTAKDFVKIVFSDAYIQQDFQNIKSQFSTEGLIDNIDQIDKKISEVESVGGQIYESFILLKENKKGNWKWVWILAIAFVLIGLGINYFKSDIQHIISGAYISSVLALVWLTNVISQLAPYFKKISEFYSRLKILKNTIDKEKEKVRLKEHDEVERLTNGITNLTAQKAALEIEQTQTQEKGEILKKQIQEIGSGKLLANFLADRNADDAYLKQLGIISWIRKDFSKLNELFQNQRIVQAKEGDEGAEVQIDRIVLYIDDLDRCNEEVVVKVLEAIHLLLAFPLFVVIVGVDPRWLNNALSLKYKNLFGNDDDKNDLTEVATSYDYLEKIFQIPFALKPINKTGREKLLKYLIEGEMANNTTDAPIGKEGDLGNNNTGLKTTESKQFKEKKDGFKTMDVKIEDADAGIGHSEPQNSQVKRVRLVFTNDELEYMQKISSLYGKTPRTINRYVNIYRIIKAHGNLKVIGDYSSDEFKPIMLILAVIVGCSTFAKDFISKISKSKSSESFANFMEKEVLSNQLKTVLIPLITDIENLEMENFKRNLDLILRFSFRILSTEDESNTLRQDIKTNNKNE